MATVRHEPRSSVGAGPANTFRQLLRARFILATAVLVVAGSWSFALAAPAHMAIRLRASSGPRTVALGQTITLRLAVSGIILDARHIGKAANDAHGHIQLYLDAVPQSAYRRPSLQHWLGSVGATTIPLRLTQGVVRKAGRHRIIAALARNNNVLYRVPFAVLSLTVR